MIAGIIVLVTSDALLGMIAMIAARSQRAESYTGFPLSLAILMCISAFGLHLAVYAYAAKAAFGMSPWNPDAFLMLINAASGLFPALVYSYLLLQASSAVLTRTMYGGSDRPLPEAFTEARRLFLAGDIEASIREYKRLAQATPDSPEALLAAAGVLESANRPEEAAQILRETMRRFENADDSWTRAAQRLSSLLQGCLQQPLEAGLIHRQIQARAEKKGVRKPTPKPAPFEHQHKATARLTLADTDGAVEHYHRQYAVNPGNPRPLFAAVAALERDQRFNEAADTLREVVHRFQQDDAIWAEAAYRLAMLHENHFGDLASARTLCRRIVERTPQSKAGRLAGARLHEYLRPPEEKA